MEYTKIVFSVVLTLLFLINLVKKLKRPQKDVGNFESIPGPRKLPFIGNMLAVTGPLPHLVVTDLCRKHGGLMRLQLGEISAIVISSPELVREMYRKLDLSFAQRPDLEMGRIVMYGNTDIVQTPYGDYWRHVRKIATMELLSTKKVRSFRTIREDEASRLIESIRSSSGSSVNLSEILVDMSNTIIGRVTFGKRGAAQDELIKLVKVSFSFSFAGFDMGDILPSLKLLHAFRGVTPKLWKIRHDVDRILDSIIEEHREKLHAQNAMGSGNESGEEDIVGVLVRLQESANEELPIASSTIKGIILDMFGGGVETTSTLTEWAMSELIRNPRVMEKAQAEVRQVGKGKKGIEESDIQELSYLKFIIKETLRLHPIAPLVPRVCREQCEFDGYTIPEKTRVFVNSWAIGRDPKYWDDAESFKPERFEKLPYDYIGNNNFEFIPFGGGRRQCPGIQLALANAELPLAQMLYHFNWKPPGSTKPEDLDMTELFGITVGRKHNLCLIAEPYSTL